jgi:hypothetical protein
LSAASFPPPRVPESKSTIALVQSNGDPQRELPFHNLVWRWLYALNGTGVQKNLPSCVKVGLLDSQSSLTKWEVKLTCSRFGRTVRNM